MDINFRGFSLAKYTTQIKLAIVEQYRSGNEGYGLLAARHGVHHAKVRLWVRLYQMHGIAGLERKFSHYSAQFKLTVLQHMWDKKLSYGQAAAAFNIRSQGVLPHWERCYHHGGLDALMPRQRGKPTKMPDSPPTKKQSSTDDASRTRDELLAEVNHLRMENAYLKKLDALVQAQRKTQATTPKKRK